MKKFVLVFLFTSILFTVSAQKSKFPGKKMTAGYFGETVTHYGLTVGLEHYPYNGEKYQMILTTTIGGYQHIRNNTSLFLREQWGQRVTFGSGIILEQFIGLGYLHQFTHGGDIYEVLPNGSVVSSPNSGKPMVMPSIAIGTGYDFSRKSNAALITYIRPELFWKAPFNGYYLTHFALNAGVIFNLDKKNEK